ncbi:MAG: EcsC family protein, partial [Eubacteriaceae bacterium]|nr:EcsC family protein [Eubacteriaceae bacterium]
IIKGALSHGEELMAVDEQINRYIREGQLPEDYSRKALIEETSKTMSGELLYMKFLQGIPVVGAVGGAYDAIYMDKVSRYAQLKYRRRYLRTKIKGEEIKENE